ncbi:MAG: long-chain fatty acid transporter [Chlorobiaceae bacterium]|nr:long-chain fatty acid transporter [Chlorobiaceae bacterium]
MKTQLSAAAAATLILFAPVASFATNGYFSHGYGIRSQAVAGVGYALAQDGLAAATNPAGTALVGDRLDLDVTWLNTDRGASIGGYEFDGNGTKDFFMPEMGFTHKLNDRLSIGVAVYGNGGMNTDYATNPFDPSGASGPAGISFMQYCVTPSVAYKLTSSQAIGVGVTFAYQTFDAKGLAGFDNPYFSSAPGYVTNRGTDSATGWGVKLGWTGKVTPELTLGAAWSSKIKTSAFEKYKGLFAEGGNFDIPATYGAGMAWQVAPAWTLAADWQRIEYSSFRSGGNPMQKLLTGGVLGSPDGPGFGWKDVSVFKFGVVHKYNEDLTLRAGYSHCQHGIPSDQTFFNILCPGVVQDHFSLGASLKTSPASEWSFSYVYVPKETVYGKQSNPLSGQEVNIHMNEQLFTLGFTRMF